MYEVLFMQRRYRKIARKFYRMLRHPRQRRRSSAHRWLADKVFDRRLWVPERHAFMNGLAAGMFVTMLPLFTPQLVVSALICIWRRWNVPIALACCWISNVFTTVPQVYLQVVLGIWFLRAFGHGGGSAGDAFARLEALWHLWRSDGWSAAFAQFQPEAVAILSPLALPWAIGIVLSGILLATLSYLLGHILWSLFVHRVEVPHQVPHRHHSDNPE